MCECVCVCKHVCMHTPGKQAALPIPPTEAQFPHSYIDRKSGPSKMLTPLLGGVLGSAMITCNPTGPGGPGKPLEPSSPFCPNRPCCPRGPGSPSAPWRKEVSVSEDGQQLERWALLCHSTQILTEGPGCPMGP